MRSLSIEFMLCPELVLTDGQGSVREGALLNFASLTQPKAI